MNRMTHDEYMFFKDAFDVLKAQFIREAQQVHTDTWQGVNISQRPEARMMELLNISFCVNVGTRSRLVLAAATQCNMPWAENHFQERVCGQPINPGVEWKNWPHSLNAEKFLDENGKFNHNYMERYWPKEAGQFKSPTQTADQYKAAVNVKRMDVKVEGLRGIYNYYGDLDDVVNLMGRDPLTRQAYLPVFFPEDTGSVHGDRVPCTLGYHFIVRNDKLHCVYYLRSCDFVRHFRDDVYLSVRLQMWVLEQLQERFGERWLKVTPGSFTMHVTSLHCFVNDFQGL